MPDILEISTCTNKEVKFWLSTITMLKYSPLVPLILFKLWATKLLVCKGTQSSEPTKRKTQFDDFFRLSTFCFPTFTLIFSFPSILLRAISVLMRILLFLLRKICYVHNATHQHLACDEKHDDFIIFSAVFLKKLYIYS